MRIACQTLPYANVYLDTSLQVIHVEWDGLVPSYVFRQTIACVLELLKSREVYGCIYDLAKLKSIPPQDQDWLIEEVVPLLSKSSLRKVAFLESFTRLGQLNMSELVYSSFPTINFEFQYFENVEAAMEWLGQKNFTAQRHKFANGRAKLSAV